VASRSCLSGPFVKGALKVGCTFWSCDDELFEALADGSCWWPVGQDEKMSGKCYWTITDSQISKRFLGVSWDPLMAWAYKYTCAWVSIWGIVWYFHINSLRFTLLTFAPLPRSPLGQLDFSRRFTTSVKHFQWPAVCNRHSRSASDLNIQILQTYT